MTLYDDPFEPKDSDELVERQPQHSPEEIAQAHDDGHIVQKLQVYYHKQRQQESLNNVWGNIASKYDAMLPAFSGEKLVLPESGEIERIDQNHMQQDIPTIPQMKKHSRSWGAFAVAAILLFVMGSMAVIMTRMNETTGTGGHSKPTSVPVVPTAAPTRLPVVVPIATPTSVPVIPIATPTGLPVVVPTAAPTRLPVIPIATPTAISRH